MAAKVRMQENVSPELLEFFDDITGSGAVTLSVVLPKATELRDTGLAFVGELSALAAALRDIGLDGPGAGVCGLAEELLAKFDEHFCAPVDLTDDEIHKADKAFRVEYGELYRRMKHCRIVTLLLQMSQALSWVPADAGGGGAGPPALAPLWDAADPDRVRSVVVLRAADIGCDLDFARIHATGDSGPVWPVLFRIYELGDVLYNTLNKPDFDPDRLCRAVQGSITSFRKQLHGAEAGFRMIEQSTAMFRENAGKYQERIEATGNPMEIYTCYFQDLQTKADNMDKRTKMAFLRIVRHVQTMSAHATRAAPHSKGSRLLSSLTKSVDSAVEQATDDMMKTGSAADTAELLAELRATKKADEEAARRHGEAAGARIADVAIFPQPGAAAPARAGPGCAANIDDLVAWIDAPAPKARKSKGKAKAERPA